MVASVDRMSRSNTTSPPLGRTFGTASMTAGAARAGTDRTASRDAVGGSTTIRSRTCADAGWLVAQKSSASGRAFVGKRGRFASGYVRWSTLRSRSAPSLFDIGDTPLRCRQSIRPMRICSLLLHCDERGDIARRRRAMGLRTDDSSDEGRDLIDGVRPTITELSMIIV